MAVPAVGRMAPDFSLATDDGSTLQLKSLRGRPVVLFFYPKDDTTTCTKEACEFRDLFPRFDQAKAVVLGVTGKTENAFDASVHDTIYLGEVAQHQVQVGLLHSGSFNGTNFKVFELNPKFVAQDNQAERTVAWVDPKDVVVLKK